LAFTPDQKKAYMEWDVINSSASYLSDKVSAGHFDFFGKTMQGRKEDYPRWKKGQHRNTVDTELQTVLELLQADEPLPEKYRDHALVSNWVGHRDCHIKPDLVLIYKKTEEGELLILKLVRLGSHSELAI
jgi:mRNA interferase YafQ